MFATTRSVVGYRKGGKSIKPLLELELIITRREGGLKSCAGVLDRIQPIVRRSTSVIHDDGKRHGGHARLPRCNDRRPVMMGTMATQTVHKRGTVRAQ